MAAITKLISIHQGQFFSGNAYRIYLLGNPVIWWGNLVLLAVFCVVFLWQQLCKQRSPELYTEQNKKITACIWLLLGWWLHYAPFWVMGRVLYFHHYFPALMFSSMLSGKVLLQPFIKLLKLFFLSGVIYSYLLEVVENVLPEKLAHTVRHVMLGLFISTVIYR